MATKIKPLRTNLLVERIEEPGKTKGGILIPEMAKEKATEAKVIAAGPGTEDHKMTVRAGDRILFAKYSGAEIRVDDKTLLVLDEDDVLAVVVG